MILINSRVTGPNLTKFIYNVEKSLPLNPLKSELRYSNPFQNARATNEGVQADFASKIGGYRKVP